MKKKIILFKFYFIIIGIILLSISCEKNKTDNREIICGTKDPLQEIEWLKNLVSQLENNPPAAIYIYTYNGEKVFAVTPCTDCPDRVTQFYDCDGNFICFFGGYTGTNTCPGFDSLAVKDTLLWKNY